MIDNYTATITAADLQAIEIYGQWEQHVERFGLYNLPTEVRNPYKLGRKLLNEVLSLKPKTKWDDIKWTGGEYDALALAYCTYPGDNKQCLIEFRKYSDRHTFLYSIYPVFLR